MFFDKKWCKTFIIITLVVFLVGALLYGTLAFVSKDFLEQASNERIPSYAMAFYPLGGGWLLSGITGGIMIFSRWIGKQNIILKVLCAVFFPFTFFAVVFVGLFGTPIIFVRCILFIKREQES